MGCIGSKPRLGGSFASHEQLARETHCKLLMISFLTQLTAFPSVAVKNFCAFLTISLQILCLCAVSIDEVYALEELFKDLSNRLHKVSLPPGPPCLCHAVDGPSQLEKASLNLSLHFCACTREHLKLECA